MATSRRSFLGLAVVIVVAGGLSQWWAGRSEQRVAEQLAARAQPGDIRMLSSTTCAYCTVARRWMQAHGVSFSECFIETDKDCAALFEATRSPGTPVMLVRGQPQVGFDARRVLDTLSATGG
ncbi:MAG: hypothetical protein J0M00_16715 [Burkholderiales bacterium]|nr:hypothetical protein [Burkholderiales bacterium]